MPVSGKARNSLSLSPGYGKTDLKNSILALLRTVEKYSQQLNESEESFPTRVSITKSLETIPKSGSKQVGPSLSTATSLATRPRKSSSNKCLSFHIFCGTVHIIYIRTVHIIYTLLHFFFGYHLQCVMIVTLFWLHFQYGASTSRKKISHFLFACYLTFMLNEKILF